MQSNIIEININMHKGVYSRHVIYWRRLFALSFSSAAVSRVWPHIEIQRFQEMLSCAATCFTACRCAGLHLNTWSMYQNINKTIANAIQYHKIGMSTVIASSGLINVWEVSFWKQRMGESLCLYQKMPNQRMIRSQMQVDWFEAQPFRRAHVQVIVRKSAASCLDYAASTWNVCANEMHWKVISGRCARGSSCGCLRFRQSVTISKQSMVFLPGCPCID